MTNKIGLEKEMKINTVSGDPCVINKNKFVYCKSDNSETVQNVPWFTVIHNEDGTYSLKQGDYYCLHDRKTKGIKCDSPTWSRSSDYQIGIRPNGWNSLKYRDLPCFVADDYYLKCTNMNNPAPDTFSDRADIQFNMVDFSKDLAIKLSSFEDNTQQDWVYGKMGTLPQANLVKKMKAFDLTHDFLVNSRLDEYLIGENYTFCAWIKWQIGVKPRVVITTKNGNYPLIIGNGFIGGSDLKKKYPAPDLRESDWCFVGMYGKTNRAYHTRTYFFANATSKSVNYIGNDNVPLLGQHLISIGGDYNYLGLLTQFWYLQRTLTTAEINNLFTHTSNVYINN